MHVVSAGLRLRLRLSHHGGTERVDGGGLAGPRGGLRHEGRGPRGGAWAAGVKGRCAAMETGSVASSTPDAAAAQIHGQSLLCGENKEEKPTSEHNFSAGCGIILSSLFIVL